MVPCFAVEPCTDTKAKALMHLVLQLMLDVQHATNKQRTYIVQNAAFAMGLRYAGGEWYAWWKHFRSHIVLLNSFLAQAHAGPLLSVQLP